MHESKRRQEPLILNDKHINAMFGTDGGTKTFRKNYMQDETLKRMKEDLYALQADMAEKEHKMEQLVSKLYVDFDGDALQGSYKLRFSHFENERNEIQRSIIKSVVELYGLELQREREKLNDFLSFVEAVFSEKDYCEVDLLNMTEQKQPVQC